MGIETKEDIVESDTYIFFSAMRAMLFDKIFRKDMTIEEKLTEVLSATESFQVIPDCSAEPYSLDFSFPSILPNCPF